MANWIKSISQSVLWSGVVSRRTAFLLLAWIDILLVAGSLSRCAWSGHRVRSSRPLTVGREFTACISPADWRLSICSGIYQWPVTSSDLLLTAVLCVCVCDMALVEPVIVLLLELPRALPLSAHRKSYVLTNAHLQMPNKPYTTPNKSKYTRQPYNYT